MYPKKEATIKMVSSLIPGISTMAYLVTNAGAPVVGVFVLTQVRGLSIDTISSLCL